MTTATEAGSQQLDPRPMWRVLADVLGQQGKRLLQVEAAYVRQEAQEGVRDAARGGLLLAGSAWMGLTGLSALVVAAALAIPERPVRGALWTGLGLVGGSLALGLAGLRALPTRPVARTVDGLKADASAVKQTVATALTGSAESPAGAPPPSH